MWWKSLCAALLICIAAGAQARWLRADTPNFILYSDGNERGLRDYATVIEDFDAFLRSMFGVKEPAGVNRLTIYLVGSASQLRQYRALPSIAVGIYIATPAGIAAYATRGEGDEDGQSVLLHEYAHHFMLQYFPAGYPAWYVEGFAEYMMTAKFKPATIEWGFFNEGRATWLVNGDWLSPAEMLEPSSSKRRFSGADAMMFYAQSWLMVHYFYREPARAASFKKYMTDVVGGRDSAKAFVAAFGFPYTELNARLQTYRRGRLTYSVRTRASERLPVPMTVTALPPVANAMLPEQAALRLGAEDKYGPALLANTRRDAARFAADPYAQRVLAHAEVVAGDAAKGAALLDTLLAGDGAKDAELQYLRGLAELKTDNPIKARPYFARAHKLDPNQYQALYRYGLTFATADKPPTDNTINILLLAHQLAPQVGDIAMSAATMLIQRQRYAEARVLLQPVALNPHGGADKDAAQAMLDEAIKHIAPAVAAQ